MGTLRLVSLTGSGVTVLGLAIAVRFAFVPPVIVRTVRDDEGHAAEAGPAGALADHDSLARSITARNPFRLHRSAATVAFDPSRPDGAPPTAPVTTTRPTIALAGVVLGPEPSALIEGLPGVEGSRLVRVGETVAGYVLRGVTAQGAVLSAPDTTLVLRLRSIP